MTRPAFTLIEMLVATVLSAVLMAAILTVLAGVARDRRLLRALPSATPSRGIDLLEWDVRNAAAIRGGHDRGIALELEGNGGIDRATLRPDGRLVRVVYRTARAGDALALWRQQRYLDDPARPAPWQSLVAADVRACTAGNVGATFAPVSDRVELTFATATTTQKRTVTR